MAMIAERAQILEKIQAKIHSISLEKQREFSESVGSHVEMLKRLMETSLKSNGTIYSPSKRAKVDNVARNICEKIGAQRSNSKTTDASHFTTPIKPANISMDLTKELPLRRSARLNDRKTNEAPSIPKTHEGLFKTPLPVGMIKNPRSSSSIGSRLSSISSLDDGTATESERDSISNPSYGRRNVSSVNNNKPVRRSARLREKREVRESMLSDEKENNQILENIQTQQIQIQKQVIQQLQKLHKDNEEKQQKLQQQQLQQQQLQQALQQKQQELLRQQQQEQERLKRLQQEDDEKRELELQKELERKREMERQRESERQRELERQKELERQQELERQREIEEQQRLQELEQLKEDEQKEMEQDNEVESDGEPEQKTVAMLHLNESKKNIVEEIFKDVTPKKPSPSSTHYSLSSTISMLSNPSSPRDSIASFQMSTARSSVLSSISVTSPVLHDVRKDRVKPNPSRRKMSNHLTETERRLKKAEENRLKMQNQAKQEEEERRKKKELQTKRAQELAAERKKKEQEQLRKINDEKKRKRDEQEAAFKEEQRKKKEKMDEKFKILKEREKKRKEGEDMEPSAGKEVVVKELPKEAPTKELAKPKVAPATKESIVTNNVEPPAQKITTTTTVITTTTSSSTSSTTATEEKPKPAQGSAIGTFINYINSMITGSSSVPSTTTTTAASTMSKIPVLSNLTSYSSNVPNLPLSESKLMPPPASPLKVARTITPPGRPASPSRSQYARATLEAVIACLRMFLVSTQAYNGVSTGLSFITKEHMEKLQRIMSVEEFYKFKKKLTNLGWNSEVGGFYPEVNKIALTRFISECIDEYQSTLNVLSGKPKTLLSAIVEEDIESYEISDYSSSDSESDSGSDDEKPRKKIPLWAKGAALDTALRQQQGQDPDLIFPEVFSCNLDDIFEGIKNKKSKRRLERRESSGNWAHDGLTLVEKLNYKKALNLR